MGKFRHSLSGSMAVEFALMAPLVCVLIFMMLEVGFTITMQYMLDNAAADASRLIRTGAAQASGSSSSFYAKLCSDTSLLLTCSNIKFNVQSGASFSALSTTLTTDSNGAMANTAYAPGAAGSDVLVQVGYNRTLFTPFVSKFFGKNGRFLVLSSVVFQNEPY
jgi:Flp pilus assembly protein TadG